SARGHLCRSHSQGGDTERTARPSAGEVRASHQPQDREGPRPDHFADVAAASRRDHPVMDRRAFISFVGGNILAGRLVVDAQQPTKARRIGLLIGSSESFVAPFIVIFRQALRALGYVDGGNIAIEYRYADGNYDRLPVLAAELVRLKFDVVVTEGTPPTRAAK